MTEYLDNLFYGASVKIQQRAKELRKSMTVAEKLLWRQIRNKKLGYKIRRQHPIYIFIADFYCHEKKLVIEIDGEIHNTPENSEYDANRTVEMERLGIKVILYKNQDIKNNLPEILVNMQKELDERVIN